MIWKRYLNFGNMQLNNWGGGGEALRGFLKLKQELQVYPVWVHSEEDKDLYIEEYDRLKRLFLTGYPLQRN